MNIPEWIHPILRKVFSNMVHDEWSKAGRPILAENVHVLESSAQVIRNGWVSLSCDATMFQGLSDSTKILVLIIEEEK